MFQNDLFFSMCMRVNEMNALPLCRTHSRPCVSAKSPRRPSFCLFALLLECQHSRLPFPVAKPRKAATGFQHRKRKSAAIFISCSNHSQVQGMAWRLPAEPPDLILTPLLPEPYSHAKVVTLPTFWQRAEEEAGGDVWGWVPSSKQTS